MVVLLLYADHLLPVEQAVGEHLAGADGDRHGSKVNEDVQDGWLVVAECRLR